MQPTIYLAFVDDWELRGNGSGDQESLQFRPMRELVRIFNRYGIRASFNAEVMQQLTFRKLQTQHPELRKPADDWDANVRETYRQGHDIQLHIHPQWREAAYENGQWQLTADWNILNHPAEAALEMLTAGRDYLEGLLRPTDPTYRCLSFRSGAWCIAPSKHILGLLVRLGIVFDMSIVGGMRFNSKNVQLDYRDCEEDFLPYYPNMEDARRVSDKIEEIICVPTNQFFESRFHLLRKHTSKARQKVRKRLRPDEFTKDEGAKPQNYYSEWAEIDAPSRFKRIFKNVISPYLTGVQFVSDIAQLDYSLMSEMLRSIRRRARASRLGEVPIVLENHTKDISDFAHIERFVAEVSKAPDIKCVTLSELARELKNGRFQIKTATHK
jgi:hypothetical protein